MISICIFQIKKRLIHLFQDFFFKLKILNSNVFFKNHFIFLPKMVFIHEKKLYDSWDAFHRQHGQAFPLLPRVSGYVDKRCTWTMLHNGGLPHDAQMGTSIHIEDVYNLLLDMAYKT
jgi:hypothetical protein